MWDRLLKSLKVASFWAQLNSEFRQIWKQLSHFKSPWLWSKHGQRPRSIIRICEQWQEAAVQVFCKKGALRIFAKFTGKHLCQSLFLINFFQKAALAQVFFCEFCDISKNTFSHRTPPVATSEWSTVMFENYFFKKEDHNPGNFQWVMLQSWKTSSF